MSRLGGVTAFMAEAALWVTGAALVAGAAGASFELPGINLAGLTGPHPSASASTNPTPSAAPSTGVAVASVASVAPPSSPGLSPVVASYRSAVTAANFQFKAKFTETETAAPGDPPIDFTVSGTMAYKAGDDTSSQRQTSQGAVTTYDYVHLGNATYQSKNGAAWTKSDRAPADIQTDKILFAPTMAFVDNGIEAKNGAQLHRLEVADPAAFSAALLTNSTGATDGLLTYIAWVDDNGVPAAFRIEGWVAKQVNGVSRKVTTVQEFRIIATTGVNIVAPI